jgi:hypothetical protein
VAIRLRNLSALYSPRAGLHPAPADDVPLNRLQLIEAASIDTRAVTSSPGAMNAACSKH